MSDIQDELNRVIADWNALVGAIGSPTHGGAIGYAKQLRTDRDELRNILIRMLTAYAAGHVVCNVPDSQWWPALEAAQYMLGAQQETQLIKVATEARS